jgi:hypothetical protein
MSAQKEDVGVDRLSKGECIQEIGESKHSYSSQCQMSQEDGQLGFSSAGVSMNSSFFSREPWCDSALLRLDEYVF